MRQPVDSVHEKRNMARGHEGIFTGDDFDVLFDILEKYENEICQQISQKWFHLLNFVIKFNNKARLKH